ncbi:MAG: hypothetical protein K2G55_20050 [Lachnospiraceae bacterium]|nr:hypothetical protein [Lachnospiraceae bacterium]MDE7205428.1 hypothetical protein [Lachnospiraceae bacterium]
MKEDEVYSLRKARQQIIEICREICIQRWGMADRHWKLFETELMQPAFSELIGSIFFKECKICIAKKNYMRVHDLLQYDIDLNIAAQLLQLSEESRITLAKKAKKQNMETLEKYHKKIFASIQDVKKSARIKFSYTGTENISIYVREKKCEYKLFSSANPWMEGADLADGMKAENPKEICVLGFSGGYVVNELAKRFEQAKIKVYLPNIDIFKVIIDNILVCNILQNKNIEFYPDPMGLMFFVKIWESVGQYEDFAFYIDRSELRACVGDQIVTDRLIRESKQVQCRGLGISRAKDLVGIRIEQYIMNLIK